MSRNTPNSYYSHTPVSWRAHQEAACQRWLGVSRDVFLARWRTGELDWDTPESVTPVAMMFSDAELFPEEP